MDHLPDLTFLSEEETNLILGVLQRDVELRHGQKNRASQVKKEVHDLRMKSVLRNGDDQTKMCARCKTPFGFLFNTGDVCPVCRFRVCKDCREARINSHGWMCTLCFKENQLRWLSGATLAGTPREKRDDDGDDPSESDPGVSHFGTSDSTSVSESLLIGNGDSRHPQRREEEEEMEVKERNGQEEEDTGGDSAYSTAGSGATSVHTDHGTCPLDLRADSGHVEGSSAAPRALPESHDSRPVVGANDSLEDVESIPEPDSQNDLERSLCSDRTEDARAELTIRETPEQDDNAQNVEVDGGSDLDQNSCCASIGSQQEDTQSSEHECLDENIQESESVPQPTCPSPPVKVDDAPVQPSQKTAVPTLEEQIAEVQKMRNPENLSYTMQRYFQGEDTGSDTLSIISERTEPEDTDNRTDKQFTMCTDDDSDSEGTVHDDLEGHWSDDSSDVLDAAATTPRRQSVVNVDEADLLPLQQPTNGSPQPEPESDPDTPPASDQDSVTQNDHHPSENNKEDCSETVETSPLPRSLSVEDCSVQTNLLIVPLKDTAPDPHVLDTSEGNLHGGSIPSEDSSTQTEEVLVISKEEHDLFQDLLMQQEMGRTRLHRTFSEDWTQTDSTSAEEGEDHQNAHLESESVSTLQNSAIFADEADSLVTHETAEQEKGMANVGSLNVCMQSKPNDHQLDSQDNTTINTWHETQHAISVTEVKDIDAAVDDNEKVKTVSVTEVTDTDVAEDSDERKMLTVTEVNGTDVAVERSDVGKKLASVTEVHNTDAVAEENDEEETLPVTEMNYTDASVSDTDDTLKDNNESKTSSVREEKDTGDFVEDNDEGKTLSVREEKESGVSVEDNDEGKTLSVTEVNSFEGKTLLASEVNDTDAVVEEETIEGVTAGPLHPVDETVLNEGVLLDKDELCLPASNEPVYQNTVNKDGVTSLEKREDEEDAEGLENRGAVMDPHRLGADGADACEGGEYEDPERTAQTPSPDYPRGLSPDPLGPHPQCHLRTPTPDYDPEASESRMFSLENTSRSPSVEYLPEATMDLDDLVVSAECPVVSELPLSGQALPSEAGQWEVGSGSRSGSEEMDSQASSWTFTASESTAGTVSFTAGGTLLAMVLLGAHEAERQRALTPDQSQSTEMDHVDGGSQSTDRDHLDSVSQSNEAATMSERTQRSNSMGDLTGDSAHVSQLPSQRRAFTGSVDQLNHQDDEIDGGMSRYRKRNKPLSRSRFSLAASRESLGSVYSAAGEINYGRIPVTGDITFGLEYDQKLSALRVHLKGCQDLAPVDTKHNRSDPYVKTYLLPDKSRSGKRKSKIKKRTLSPVYNETLSYTISPGELETRTLWVTVWHSDRLGRNDFLGEVNLPMEMELFDNTAPRTYPLQSRITADSPDETAVQYKGDLILSLMYVTAEKAQEAREAAPKKSKSKLKKSKAAAATSPQGEIHVMIKSARHLMALRSSGASDPFVKGYLLPERSRAGKQKTQVVKNSLNPMWNHILVFEGVDVTGLADRSLELTVWDHEKLGTNEFLGGTRLNLGLGMVKDGQQVVWMDGRGEESAVWQNMMERPDTWVDAEIPLRASMGKTHAKK